MITPPAAAGPDRGQLRGLRPDGTPTGRRRGSRAWGPATGWAGSLRRPCCRPSAWAVVSAPPWPSENCVVILAGRAFSAIESRCQTYPPPPQGGGGELPYRIIHHPLAAAAQQRRPSGHRPYSKLPLCCWWLGIVCRPPTRTGIRPGTPARFPVRGSFAASERYLEQPTST